MKSDNFEGLNTDDLRSFSDWLYSLSAFEFSLYSSLIGFTIASTLTTNQQNSLGNFFELIGQVMLTFNAQNVMLDVEKAKDKENLETQVNNMQKEIERLKNIIYYQQK